MRRFIYIFLFLTLAIQVVQAKGESFKNKIEIYQYWMYRGAIELPYLYTQSYLNGKNEKGHADENDKAKEYKKTFLDNLNETNLDLGSLETLFNHSQDFLKNKSNHWSSLYQSCHQAFVTILQADSLKQFKDTISYNFSNNDFSEVCKEGLDSINKRYSGELIRFEKSEEESRKTEDSLSNTTPLVEISSPNSMTPVHSNSRWLVVTLFIICIGFISYLMYSFFSLKEKVNDLSEQEKENQEQENQENKNQLKKLDELKKNVEKNEKELKRINTILDHIKVDLDSSKSTIEKIVLRDSASKQISDKGIDCSLKNSLEVASISKKTKNSTNTQYYSMPEPDGSFIISDAYQNNDGSRRYKIEFNPNSTKAKISFVSGRDDAKFINRSNVLLTPVCSIDNPSDILNSNKITMIESGHVRLDGGRWRIDQDHKIKIKLG